MGETYFYVGAMGNKYTLRYERDGWGFPFFFTNGAGLMKDRHLGGGNYSYLDGHVKWIKKEAVDAVLAEQTVEKGANGVNKDGTGLIESLGKWQEFPIVFGWAKE